MADDHNEPDPADQRVQAAAQWLIANPNRDPGEATVPTLRRLFDLDAVQAVEAIREAERLRRAST